MKISLIIATYNRLDHLERLITSLLNCVTSQFQIEVIFIINGLDVKTKDYLENTDLKNLKKQIIQIKKSNAASARNIGIQEARGVYCVFFDDDIEIPRDYFEKAHRILASNQWDVFGGPDLINHNPSKVQKAFAFCQQQTYIVGPTNSRHTQRIPQEKVTESHLILCNLWVIKKIFDDYKIFFNEDYDRNEENVLLNQLQEKGIHFYYSSDLFVRHYKKDNFHKIFKSNFESGKFRIISIIEERSYNSNHSLLFFAPLGLLLLASLFLVTEIKLLEAPIFIYLGLMIYLFIDLLKNTKSLGTSVLGFLIMPTIHIAYGLGMIRGLLMKINKFCRLRLS